VHGYFPVKSDVFVFGVVLDIISVRKNRGFCDLGHPLNLLGHIGLKFGNLYLYVNITTFVHEIIHTIYQFLIWKLNL